QRGIAEDRIEGGAKAQALSVHGGNFEIAPARGGKLGGAGIDADDTAPGGGDLFAERAVAAAEIQNVLARLRIEDLEQRLGQIGDEAGVARIGLRIQTVDEPIAVKVAFHAWLEKPQ